MSDACIYAESVRESGGKVLVFCKAGISRSAAICIAYLMQQNRMTMDEAHDYVKSRRTFISPNLNFMRQLHEFDGRLRAARARATADDRPPAPTASVGPSSPSRPVLRSLQCPLVENRRRWLSTTPTFPVDSETFPASARRSSAVARYLDANMGCAELSRAVGLSPPAAALLSIVSPGFRLSSVSAPTVGGERPTCHRDRGHLSAWTPSQMSRHVFVYPLPLNTNAKSGLVSL